MGDVDASGSGEPENKLKVKRSSITSGGLQATPGLDTSIDPDSGASPLN